VTESPPAPSLTLRKLAIQAGVMLAVTAVVALLCSLIGAAGLTSGVWKMRLLRLAVAATVGAGLAVAGMALQGLLRNPLAEPFVLGISSGAGVGVILGILLTARLGLTAWATAPVLALLGALVTCIVVYAVAQRRGRLDPYALLLSGVIVNVFNGAVILTILLFFDPNDIIEYIGWSMGRLPNWTDPALLALCGGGVVAGWAALFLRGGALNALGLGTDVAQSLGVGVQWLRVETFAIVAMMTAAAVALAGPVGFIGLIVPHICRLILGPDHRRLALFSGFGGAIFLMVADTIGRSAGGWISVGGRALGDVPVGIITAMTGGPFFIYLLRRRFREGAA